MVLVKGDPRQLHLLLGLRKEHGLTYIMVSHDLAVVGNLCERIAVMNRGLIVEEITDEQLRTDTPNHGYTQLLAHAGQFGHF